MARILGLIPARSGSKGIPNKNIVDLNGKPLLNYTIEAALAAKTLDNVVVSTDSQTIADTALAAGAEVPFLRPSEFSGDRSAAVEVIQHAIDYYAQQDQHYDYIVYLQPTSPLRTTQDIQAAITLMQASPADALVSVMEVPHQFGFESLMVEANGLVTPAQKTQSLRRQEKVPYVARNGPAIVITTPATLRDYDSLYGETTLAYTMPAKRSADIDSLDDLEYVAWLMQKEQ